MDWDLQSTRIGANKVLLYTSIIPDHVQRIHNDVVHNRGTLNAFACSSMVISSYSSFCTGLLPIIPTFIGLPLPRSPLEGSNKVYFDVIIGFMNMALANICRNHDQSISFIKACIVLSSSPVVGEASIATPGVPEAIKLGIHFCMVEGYTKVVISSINQNCYQNRECSNVIACHYNLLPMFRAICLAMILGKSMLLIIMLQNGLFFEMSRVSFLGLLSPLISSVLMLRGCFLNFEVHSFY